MTSDETHPVPAHRLAAEDAADAVIEGWSRLFTYLVVAIEVAFTVVLPFFGLLLALVAPRTCERPTGTRAVTEAACCARWRGR